MTDNSREALGRLVREVWVEWAQEQPGAKPSWLAPWEDLNDGQREVDMRIGEAVAAAERARMTDNHCAPVVLVAQISDSPWPELAGKRCHGADLRGAHEATWVVWTERETGDGMRLACNIDLGEWVSTVYQRFPRDWRNRNAARP